MVSLNDSGIDQTSTSEVGQSFEPKCMATTIATMPFRDPDEACRIILENFPEAPPLPKLTNSQRQYLSSMPCLNIDREKRRVTFDLSKHDEIEQFYERYFSEDLEYFAMDPKDAQGFYALLDVLRESPPPELKIVHLGVTGCITFGLALKDHQTEKPALYDLNMRDIIIKTLVMKAKWQEKKIREILPGVKTMITTGEPSLGIIDTPFGSISTEEVVNVYDELFGDLESMGCVHCCDNMDWSKLMKTRTRIINPDAYEFMDKFALYPEELKVYLNHGGTFAWGIVPVGEETLASENLDSLLDRLEAGMEMMASAGLDKAFLLKRSFITPACSTSNLSITQAERAFRLTKDISQTMRDRYF
ncbi:hypothetical protein ACFL9U_10560 [Thermodesulfobacteriota bacterium]